MGGIKCSEFLYIAGESYLLSGLKGQSLVYSSSCQRPTWGWLSGPGHHLLGKGPSQVEGSVHYSDGPPLLRQSR